MVGSREPQAWKLSSGQKPEICNVQLMTNDKAQMTK